MSWGNKNQKIIILSVVSVFLTAMTMILGAPFLKVLRRETPFAIFWLLAIAVSSALYFLSQPSLALMNLIAFTIIGVYHEAEVKNISRFKSGVFAVASGFITTVIGVKFWLLMNPQVNLLAQMTTAVEQLLAQTKKMGNEMPFDVAAVISQLPSALISTIIVFLAVALIYEKRVSYWFELNLDQTKTQASLLTFKVPDFLIWVTMFSLLASFINVGNKDINVIGSNILNVMMILYFWQGLAVTEVFFRSFKVFFLIRFFAYFILISQLFPILSGIGVIDFWVNFRDRFSKMTAAKAN